MGFALFIVVWIIFLHYSVPLTAISGCVLLCALFNGD